jgi:DNA polymerase I-like protein with 3'-5' exonuclease and polymerase domains
MATLNIQQMNKSSKFLSTWVARHGHKIVSLDFSALEPVVLTAASKDPALWKVYGPNSKPNDIYLFTAAQIPGLGDNILKYYDPDNPTEESIALAKKHCKPDRAVAKVVVLASNYNAGPSKIHETLTLSGHDISMDEVERIHENYWELYKGIAQFATTLKQEWRRNKGYILNGLGRPLTVAEHLTKDLVNRYVQSTGHDLLMLYIAKIQKLRVERGVEMYPWIVDYHDETMWEVPVKAVEKAVLVFKDALKWLNDNRITAIPVKGDVLVADNLAQIKIEE